MVVEIDTLFAHRVAEHCLGTHVVHAKPEHRSQFSLAFTCWDGAHSLLDKFGKPQPLALLDDGQIVPTVLERKFQRVAATLNEIKGYDHAAPLRLDMLDARAYGMADTPVNWPVITYNRRKNAIDNLPFAPPQNRDLYLSLVLEGLDAG